jgi:hypothetical protein
VLDVFVSEVVLQGARVVPVIGEFETTGVAQHVRVDREGHLGLFAEPTHHAPEPNSTHWRPALAHEHIAPWFLFPLQSAKRSKLGACERMHRIDAVLGAEDVQTPVDKVDL